MEYPEEKTHYALKMETCDTSVLGNVPGFKRFLMIGFLKGHGPSQCGSLEMRCRFECAR